MSSVLFDTIEPGEKVPVTIDYSAAGAAPSGATVTSGTVAAIDLSDGSSANNILSSTIASTTSTTAAIYVTAPSGANGKRYAVTFSSTFSDGSIFKKVVVIPVKDSRR